MTTTATPYAITFSKGDVDRRYYVFLDGEKVGWVLKDYEGRWAFYASVRQWAKGERLAGGEKTRRDAVAEGLSSLRIWHGSGIRHLNMETMEEEWRVFDGKRLEATWDHLLDLKYGLA